MILEFDLKEHGKTGRPKHHRVEVESFDAARKVIAKEIKRKKTSLSNITIKSKALA